MGPILNGYCAVGLFNSQKWTPMSCTWHWWRVITCYTNLEKLADDVNKFSGLSVHFHTCYSQPKSKGVAAECGVFENLH